ncbi:MAG: Flp pilus assembly complex ATPase component TadA [Candidatus Atribacteria bacterium]|nr:Flp pilus assembly complex ATPase component TadA [Candidatus Atribacteria bacterium]
MEMSTLNSKKLGEILVAKRFITFDQLMKAIEIQKKTGEKLGEILRREGFVKEKELYQALAEQLGTLYIDLDNYVVDPNAVTRLPEKFCRQKHCVAVNEEASFMVLAMVNPVDIVTIDRARLMTKKDIHPAIAPPDVIDSIINSYYGGGSSVNEILKEAEEEEGMIYLDEAEELKIDQLKEMGEEAPIIRVVNMIILQAIRAGASDIHIEPHEDRVRIRYRIDGILQDSTTTSIKIHPALISRIKILCRMNIAERRLPQDGRFQVTVENRTIDFRVSSLPTIFGEKIVMRILDKSSLLLNLDRLGFEPDDLQRFYRMIERPYGMVLLTGPTGSGKTTTLYSALNHVSSPDLNIITIEDPVEYILDGINQIQVKPKIDLTFANSLRAIMRQDPDIIMVGEIRDRETAEIAIHAALTGHLVFSTLHTNTAPGAVTRLQEMGVASFLISSAIIGVVAQRLARKICEYCKYPVELNGDAALDLTDGKKDQVVVYQGKGCSHCNSGYKGRVAIHSIFNLSDQLREMILNHATERELTETARKEGMRTLRENAAIKVLTGIISPEEMYRVTANI